MTGMINVNITSIARHELTFICYSKHLDIYSGVKVPRIEIIKKFIAKVITIIVTCTCVYGYVYKKYCK